MIGIPRRDFLLAAAAARFSAAVSKLRAASRARIQVGVTDWDLRLTARVEAVAMARRIGFDGVEVSLGNKPKDGRLPQDDPEIIQRYRAAAAEHQLTLASTCLDALHNFYLKSDPLAPKLLADAIRVTAALSARVILLPSFGKAAPAEPAEQERVAALLKEHVGAAASAGITLCLENDLSAEINARILELCPSPALKVYYDTGNSFNRGYDVLREIRYLGRERIGQVHFKDGKSYLGEGKIDFNAVAQALNDIGYQGFIVLETPSPSGDIEADMRRNLAFVRRLFQTAA
jgi:L-ribulose-5-phosphate 3-epimerase